MTRGAIRTMKIYGFPRAQYDECFSSWHFRCLQATKEDALLLNDPAYTVEPDFWLTHNITFQSARDRDVACKLRQFFREETAWVLPWGQRRAYCYACLCGDIKAGLIPYWRKKWCYLHCPICIDHYCQLEVLPGFSVGIDKPWVAFSYSCKNTTYNYGRVLVARPCQRMIFLSLQVQLLISRAHKGSQLRLPNARIRYNSEEIKSFCRFLFESFLYPRFHFSDRDGLARGCQRGQHRLFRESDFKKGALLGANRENGKNRTLRFSRQP